MQRETILLVEDDTSLRHAAKIFLEHSGYKVLEAANGVDALFISSQFKAPIHLLLTDVDMSPMPGTQLAEQILLHRPETRVLFMSGYSEDDQVKNDMLVLEAHYLPKPFNPAILADSVRNILDIER